MRPAMLALLFPDPDDEIGLPEEPAVAVETKPVTHLVFVYGTLKRNMKNHNSFLREAKYLGEHCTDPEYTMKHLGGFPGVMKDGNTAIIGEVFEIQDEVLPRLDRLESVPNLYQRHILKTPYGEAFWYLMNKVRSFESDAQNIKTGFWTEEEDNWFMRHPAASHHVY